MSMLASAITPEELPSSPTSRKRAVSSRVKAARRRIEVVLRLGTSEAAIRKWGPVDLVPLLGEI